MKPKESIPMFEAGVYYHRPSVFEVMPRKHNFKVFLYRWHSSKGHTGIEHVYTETHKDFLALLRYWTRAGWYYTELEEYVSKRDWTAFINAEHYRLHSGGPYTRMRRKAEER